MIVVVADTYAWDERGPRVAALQEALGVATDGWYGSATQRAHRNALEFLGMPIDTLPVPVLPPGPDPSEWAALRECESNGNYAITSRSGKYRGAYQFDRSTWNSVAERHAPQLVGVDPAAAAPAEQDADGPRPLQRARRPPLAPLRPPPHLTRTPRTAPSNHVCVRFRVGRVTRTATQTWLLWQIRSGGGTGQRVEEQLVVGEDADVEAGDLGLVVPASNAHCGVVMGEPLESCHLVGRHGSTLERKTSG